MYHHQGYNGSIKAEYPYYQNTFYIKPQSEEIQERVQNLKKEIGSIYVWRAKSNNFLDMNLLYDE